MKPPGSLRASWRVLVWPMVGTVLVLIGLAVLGRVTPSSPITGSPRFSREPVSLPPQTAAPSAPPMSMPPVPADAPAAAAATAVGQVLVALAVVLGLAVVGIIVWRVVRLVRARYRPSGIDDTTPAASVDLVEVRRHLDATRHEIDVTGDVNAAVVRCWQGLEAAAADAGTERRPSQTAGEYTVAVLGDADLPQEALERLAGLYERALFSESVLTEDDRGAAVDALHDLVASIGDRAADRRSDASEPPVGA